MSKISIKDVEVNSFVVCKGLGVPDDQEKVYLYGDKSCTRIEKREAYGESYGEFKDESFFVYYLYELTQDVILNNPVKDGAVQLIKSNLDHYRLREEGICIIYVFKTYEEVRSLAHLLFDPDEHN